MTSALRYAEVIGDPIDHSKSPLVHRFWLGKLGLEGDYRATRVARDGLRDYFAARRADRNWLGCNVTMPLKLAAPAYLDAVRDPASPDEPINLVTRVGDGLKGTNTDVHGLLEPLRAIERRRAEVAGSESGLRPRTAVILGAGGVLHSVIRVCKSLGYRPVVVVARSEEKVRHACGGADGKVRFLGWGAPLPPCDLLVNATPLGMEGMAPQPYDSAMVRDGGIVFDMIYRPLKTSLLIDARRRGHRIVDGLDMLVAQAAPSFEGLFGAPAPRQHDEELRRLLVA